MTVIHTTDPTTQALKHLYEGREDAARRLTETATNAEVVHAIAEADALMMLGHGNEYGLFSNPNTHGEYERLLVSGRHVEFLRGKLCIGIWCRAEEFARRYGLHGLFSGMIISEMDEAALYGITTTQGELVEELDKFAQRLTFCIDHYKLEEIPSRMKALDDKHSPLTCFNYERLFWIE